MSENLLLGLVHTVPSLADDFERRILERFPSAGTIHLVDPELLSAAISGRITEDLRSRLAAHVDHLAACGVGAILVTCSSIGDVAESVAPTARVPVLRVDSSMAFEAVALASSPGALHRIAVLATLDATLGPTSRLIRRSVETSGARPDAIAVEVTLVEGAAQARGTGDLARHDQLVADAARAAARAADVVVLAQASMAPAAAGAELGVPVLTSPSGAADALIEAARAGRGSRL